MENNIETKVVSFALWGDIKKYTLGAIENSRIIKEIYPGWEAWFYVSPYVDEKIINQLKENDAVVINVPVTHKIVGAEGMFWRMFPAFNPMVDIMISRDCDSRLDYREKACVDEWLASGKSFHCIRDHPHHNIEILGGMWGCRYPKLINIPELFKVWSKFENLEGWNIFDTPLKKGDDQRFLQKFVWPLVKDDVICHDERFVYPNNRPFPKHQKNKYSTFVGEIIDV